MRIFIIQISLVAALLVGNLAYAQKNANGVRSGIAWFDQQGNEVSAHGGGIIRDKDIFYFFGEKHSDTSNAFAGFNCYSSKDLYNWKFESLALTVQDTGKLGPKRIGERVKVMKCPKTNEYVMFMHTDDSGYKDQCVGYATSKNVAGPYTFKGALLFNGKPIRKWDMGTFQDTDGKGYILIHGGDIYQLDDHYTQITSQVAKEIALGCESPAVFKKDGIYFWLGSHRTSWERNDNFYYTASSLSGPWVNRGLFVPAGSLTWNSQTTFVLPVKGTKETSYIFMGDRWSYPKQNSAATYVWQPLSIKDSILSIPKFLENWQIDLSGGNISSPAIPYAKKVSNTDQKQIAYKGKWKEVTFGNQKFSTSDQTADTFFLKFYGSQVGFYGFTNPNGGYAEVKIENASDKVILTTLVDMYSLKHNASLRFMSKILIKGNYKLTISVMGERSKWADKRRTDYGSKGNAVSIGEIIIN